MAARKTKPTTSDPTVSKAKTESYSVYDSSGKKLAGGVDRDVAVREYNQAKQRDGAEPKLVRSDGHAS